jgi:hypothetical protein
LNIIIPNKEVKKKTLLPPKEGGEGEGEKLPVPEILFGD